MQWHMLIEKPLAVDESNEKHVIALVQKFGTSMVVLCYYLFINDHVDTYTIDLNINSFQHYNQLR